MASGDTDQQHPVRSFLGLPSSFGLSDYTRFSVKVCMRGLTFRLLPNGWENFPREKEEEEIGHTIARSEPFLFRDRAFRMYVHLWRNDDADMIYVGCFLQMEDTDESYTLNVYFDSDNKIFGDYMLLSYTFNEEYPNVGYSHFMRFRWFLIPDWLEFTVWLKDID